MKRFWTEECGVSSVEYALLLAVVAAGIAVAAGSLGTAVSSEVNEATDCLNDQASCGT
ncbi:MAG: Flp family type IVb pilin [Pseudomonadota bacterium]